CDPDFFFNLVFLNLFTLKFPFIVAVAGQEDYEELCCKISLSMNTLMAQIVSGLKSKNEETRVKAARDLYHYVTTELREISVEDLTVFIDDFNHHIFEMVSSADVNEKKGGLLAIISLIGVDVGNTSTKISRFANYLRNLLPSSDTGVMELAAKAVGRLALASVTYTAEYVEFEVKRAFEWLTGDRIEGRRQAAVLVLRELAVCTPTFFFQQEQQFFDCIFNGVRDPKPSIREGAVAAVRAALVLTAQRESKETQKPMWYKLCYDEAEQGFEDITPREKGVNRDDRIHGSLILINELLRCSSAEGERLRQELHETAQQQQNHDQSYKELVYHSRLKPPVLFSLNFQHLHQKGTSNQLLTTTLFASLQQSPKLPVCESNTCKELMNENFDQICEQVLKQRNTRSVFVQQTLLAVLPRLASFQTQKFIDGYLNDTMSYLLGCLRRERERFNAFTAVGLLAVAVGSDVKPYLPKIMEIIKASLPSKETPSKKKAPGVDPSVYSCISLLAKAVGLAVRNDIRDLLDSMLASCSDCIPAGLGYGNTSIKKDIQDGLLQMLSFIIMHKPLCHPGTPKNNSSTSLTANFASLSEVSDVTSITLALRTLGSFDFNGHSLMPFVSHCAECFLNHEHKEIRMESVRTCCRLLSPALQPPQGRYSQKSAQIICDVLSKLLIVGITDTDPDIRFCVLASLDERFDTHLAQAENLSSLFVALNDEVFEIREVAIGTIGRLSRLNPAYVMPPLRKTLIQILTELENSGLGRNKEQSARMLRHLVANAPRLIRPYMEPILKVLIPKLKDTEPNPGVVISVLAAIGELAQVSGIEMRKWIDDLLPIIMDMLQDSSSVTKREIALWTLGQLVESTSYVVEPYTKYPQLLEVLLTFLKTEQSTSIRREAIRVLGLIGALDPYRHKMNVGTINHSGDSGVVISMTDSKAEADLNQELTTSEMLVNMPSSSLEEFYPAVAIAMLMRIIRDPTLAQHHTMVVQAVTFLFKGLGIKCVPYLQQVMPSFLNVIRTSDNNFREDYWTVNNPLQNTIILLVEQIAIALGAEFKIYVPRLIPQILKVFMYDNSTNRTVTLKLLLALQKFGSNLDDYLHLILPPIVRLFDSQEVPIAVRRCALETVDHLTESLDFTDYASRIIHPLVRTLDSTPELRHVAMETLTALVVQLGKKYEIFVPMVHKVLAKHRINHELYDVLTCRIFRSSTTSVEEDDPLLSPNRYTRPKSREHENTVGISDTPTIKKLHVIAVNLQRAWTATRRVSKDDWLEWLRRLSIELLKESPSPALRSCWALAQTYSQLPKDLFNAAFVSCWTELNEQQQDELIQSLEQALLAQDIPEITQTLLNLAEFMEHCDKGPLPLDLIHLGERAMKCRAYAKALHYKEDEFHKGPTTEVLEALISINNKLQQPEAAMGVLEYAMKNHGHDLKIQERWYEKLHDWESALQAYQQKLEQSPDDMELLLGQMRCLEALGEWGHLHQLVNEKSASVDLDMKKRMARMACAAAWGLEQWDSVREYSNLIPRDTQDGAFYGAVLAINANDFHSAQNYIDQARDLLDTELTAMVGESYQRAYGAMVIVQMLSELEEVVQYKLVPERREAIQQMWWARLKGCQRVVEDWQKIIHVHSLVVKPHEDMRTWLKYASLCRKNGRLMLSHKTLVMLLKTDPSLHPNEPLPTLHSHVTFAYTKHMWKNNQKEEAFSQLHHFVQASLYPQAIQLSTGEENEQQKDINKLLAKCYLKLGQWHESLHSINEASIPQILQWFSAATEKDKNWYKAWHALACVNFEAVLFYKHAAQQNVPTSPVGAPHSPGDKTYAPDSPNGSIRSSLLLAYTVPAIQGFFRSISLSQGNSLQDTLRLLTLWFWPEVYDALVEGIRVIQMDTWLQVIPQLIARIDTPRQLVGRLIHQLLMDIGKQHPRALIYPLTVAFKSASPARNNAAKKILKSMCEHSNTLVQQARMVSDELIRVAILWHELWHEGLEEASRLYFGERNTNGMFATLEPLHEMMERGPQTLKETSFNQAYGRDLMESQEWCRKFQRTGNVKDLTQAWDLYYHVFRRISKQLPQLTSLELQYVSPKLLMCHDLELAVPGSYNPHQPIIRIRMVQSSLQVITSKQRPRNFVLKVTLKLINLSRSNGKDFMGHEDLRQDERVMQLFGLVNTLLINDPETFRRNLTIQRYAVIPLSTNSGLIGWVPHCDTLHTLIRDYREKKKILLNIEHRIMLRMAPDYDHLTLMQKVEVFEHALEHTNGDDLAKLLWLKSPSSEIWFDRRTNYTRSLAVMSMVGYILGLGDRHPSNLMLDRLSGKILRIDFGDCFEVAMTREKFPEKIPFRLTRMLINAMEVTGMEGTYRMTCESVMNVLRVNKDSLMAVLEAFVYDPLLNWRLIDTTPKVKRSTTRTDSISSSSHEPGGDILPSVDLNGQSALTKSSIHPDSIVINYGAGDANQPEVNKKALQIIKRVREKLTGRDFSHDETLDIPNQVDLLIKQATSHENLCQCYIGWCPF
uniref:Serine/threonine-protein kinase TOR n=1 Tax=Strigamia maritima TaxID=126957 RepID=T1ISC3_STRMM